MSFSGLYARITWNTGETVSYRTLLEILLLPGVWLFTKVGRTVSHMDQPLGADIIWEMLPFSNTPEELMAKIVYWACLLGFFFSAAFLPSVFSVS